MSIIRKVKEHTNWCSSIVCSTKRDGSLRICLDPKKLNESIKRCPHKTPTLEEINPALIGAKYFSKLDAKAGYWSVPLEEQSQLLTTFRTPMGRYCYQRLPFGVCISQDIFQQRMDEILGSLEGCVGIADDMCFWYNRRRSSHGSPQIVWTCLQFREMHNKTELDIVLRQYLQCSGYVSGSVQSQRYP